MAKDKTKLIYRGPEGVNADVGEATGDAKLIDGRVLVVPASLAETLLDCDARYSVAGDDPKTKED